MPNEFSSITIDGVTYEVKDAVARQNSGGSIAPYCKAVRTASTTASSTASTISNVTLQSFEKNKDSEFTLSGGGIRCPYTGTIKIQGVIHYYSTASSAQAGCYLFKNSSEIMGVWEYGSNQPSCYTILDVNAGDVIYLRSRNSVKNAPIDYQSGGGFKNTHLIIEYMDYVKVMVV